MAPYMYAFYHEGNCAPLPVAFVVSGFFIGAQRRKLSVPRKL